MPPNPLQRQSAGRWRRVLSSTPAFCVLLAVGLVACRLIAFDGSTVDLEHFPNHDMLGAAPFMMTNLHALRTEGDLAWWNPVSYAGFGYAQYYQTFLSPMAPTPGHITFVVWGATIRILGWCGIAFPEYRQFLIYTYVVSPFLAYLVFAAFASLVFRRRCTVVLVSIAYALSGIGLWHSAWFFFQEPFTLFFLLASWVAVLKRPCVSRLMVLLTAVVVQAASINYWTVYNSWFLPLITAAYAGTHRNQTRRAWARFRIWLRGSRGRTAVVFGLTGATLILWLTLIATVAREQMLAHIRPDRQYTKQEALDRVHDTRWYTIELFNPYLPPTSPDANRMHHARYIGLVFLPLLAFLPFYRWGRTERWLAWSALGVVVVCMAPPLLLATWQRWPGMDRVLHLFYFYSHYWQIMLVLLGGAGLDRILRGTRADVLAKLIRVGITGLGIAGLIFLHYGLDGSNPHSPPLEMTTRFGLLLAISAGLLLRVLTVPSDHKQAWAWGLVLFYFADVSRYFGEVCRADRKFTTAFFAYPESLTYEVRWKLRQPWPDGQPASGFDGGLTKAFPHAFHFWPGNGFLIPARIDALSKAIPAFDASLVLGAVGGAAVQMLAKPILDASPQPVVTLCAMGTWLIVLDADLTTAELKAVRFYSDAGPAPGDPESVRRFRLESKEFIGSLALHGSVDKPAIAATAAKCSFKFTQWGYNDFTLEIDAPSDGWLRLPLLYDPLWKVWEDDRGVETCRANVLYTAVRVSAGNHAIRLSYRPRARMLYSPACWLLVLSLGTFALIGWRERRHRLNGTHTKCDQRSP